MLMLGVMSAITVHRKCNDVFAVGPTECYSEFHETKNIMQTVLIMSKSEWGRFSN